MPYRYQIDQALESGARTARGLLRLREYLDVHVPTRRLDESLIVATWNLREFDSAKYGFRTDESMAYIAEVISRFDVVAASGSSH